VDVAVDLLDGEVTRQLTAEAALEMELGVPELLLDIT